MKNKGLWDVLLYSRINRRHFKKLNRRGNIFVNIVCGTGYLQSPPYGAVGVRNLGRRLRETGETDVHTLPKEASRLVVFDSGNVFAFGNEV